MASAAEGRKVTIVWEGGFSIEFKSVAKMILLNSGLICLRRNNGRDIIVKDCLYIEAEEFFKENGEPVV